MNMKLQDLDNLYSLYRFEILPISNEKLRVYAYTSKYFSNADLIILDSSITKAEIDNISGQVNRLGFTVNIRKYKSFLEAETNLFEGFFDLKNSLKLLAKSYSDYTEKISKVIFGKYEYISSHYSEIETNSLRVDNIVDTIYNDFALDGPVLIILEAAAGFGKTSTSYEILNRLINNQPDKLPLLAELSRNKQATIFKYVLFDEINRKFTGLSLELVIKHIIEGRIPLIIDGFDELLSPGKDIKLKEQFEDAVPMLETIKELLHKGAKILLTTRRTAIFSDDDFFTWVDDNYEKFALKRYSLSTPTIADWITPTREKQLEKAGLNLKSVANPVLLAYIRSMDDLKFQDSISNIDLIIDEYISKLMDREMERQSLRMSIEEQKSILKIISNHFTNYDITSENKKTLEKLILEKSQNLIFEVIKRYPATEKTTIDDLMNKLTIHAFLDKKGDSKIGRAHV